MVSSERRSCGLLKRVWRTEMRAARGGIEAGVLDGRPPTRYYDGALFGLDDVYQCSHQLISRCHCAVVRLLLVVFALTSWRRGGLALLPTATPFLPLFRKPISSSAINMLAHTIGPRVSLLKPKQPPYICDLTMLPGQALSSWNCPWPTTRATSNGANHQLPSGVGLGKALALPTSGTLGVRCEVRS